MGRALIEDDMNELHARWQDLKRATWNARWLVGTAFGLIYIGVLVAIIVIQLAAS